MAGVLLVAATATALAQAYPSQPLKVIVPAPPGGTLDVVVRIIADDLQAALGQPVIVESKPGGAGMIGVNELLKSPRDGHTILMHISGIVSEIPHIAKASYDPFTDISPLIDLARSGLVFVGAPGFAGQYAAGGHRPCESEHRQDQLRLVFGRYALARARHPVRSGRRP